MVEQTRGRTGPLSDTGYAGHRKRTTFVAAAADSVIVSDAVAVTADGWFVLADGSAVIGPDDTLVVGEQFTREDGVRVITTPYGTEFPA